MNVVVGKLGCQMNSQWVIRFVKLFDERPLNLLRIITYLKVMHQQEVSRSFHQMRRIKDEIDIRVIDGEIRF